MDIILDEERARIARNIHDDLSQEMVALQLELSHLQESISSEDRQSHKLIEHLRSRVLVVLDKMQSIVSELRPDALEVLGLIHSIERYAQDFESRTGITCQCQMEECFIELDNMQNTHLYRIVLEALNNVARHSGASLVKVRLSLEQSTLILEISDNGKGMDPKVTLNGKAFGILGMKDRAKYLGGEFKIKGVAGKGTLIKLKLAI